MNGNQLFNKVKAWLDRIEKPLENAIILPSKDADTFDLYMTLPNGAVRMHILCEESTATVQFICTFPLLVPPEKLGPVALLLHVINADLPLGAFQLYSSQRLITFRLPMAVFPGDNDHIGFAFTAAILTADKYLRPIALSLCDTQEARSTLTGLNADAELPSAEGCSADARFELN